MRVKAGLIALMVAILAVAAPLAVQARGPKTPAELARDREIIRGLNQRELAYVRQRDARQAKGWRAWRNRGAANAEYQRQRAEHQQAMERYSQDRRRYEQRHAAWRAAVRACRAGDRSACAN